MNKPVSAIIPITEVNSLTAGHLSLILLILTVFSAERNPGVIGLEDWSQLGSVRNMGAANKCFFRTEMEKSWGEEALSHPRCGTGQKVASWSEYITCLQGRPHGCFVRSITQIQPQVRPCFHC